MKLSKADVPAPALAICERLRERGHQAYVVGGCVRDALLGRAAQDWDIASSARPEEVRRSFRRVIPTGIEHGTVTVLRDGQSYEVTTFRGESGYSDGRHPDAVYYVTDVREDLARRDFTVNAMAFDPVSEEVVDPFDGRGDLSRGTLRAVGDPVERFREDGLRILRAARFVASLELDLDPATEEAIPQALDVYRKVSAERIREEWIKSLRARTPSRAFEVMRTGGILGCTLPELLEQVGCEQNRYHAYDVWTHTMRCVDECEGEPMVRLAALLHDLGKPRARVWSEEKADYTFLHHDRIGAEMADRWMRDYRFSNAEREQVTHLVRHHLVAYSSEWSDAAVRRFVRRVGADHIPDLLTLARADTRAKGLPVDDRLAAFDELERRVADVQRQGVPLSQRDLAVSGKDLITELGLAPGPRIGQVLRALTEEVVDDPSLNARDRLLERARALIDADERRGAGAGTGGRPSTEDGHEDGAAGAASPAERAEEAGGEP